MATFSRMVIYESIQSKEEELHKEFLVARRLNKRLLKSFMKVYGLYIEESGPLLSRSRKGVCKKGYIEMCYNMWSVVLYVKYTPMRDTAMVFIQPILW